MLRPRVVGAAAGFIMGVTLFGLISQTSNDSERRASDQFWHQFLIVGDEAEFFDSLESMASASDGVVIGTPLSMTPGLVGAPSDDTSAGRFVTVTFDVTACPKPLPKVDCPERVNLEYFVPDVSRLTILEPPRNERAILFIRDKGQEARTLELGADAIALLDGRFRLVSTQGMLRGINGQTVPPVLIDPPGPFLVAVAGRPFHDIEASIRSMLETP